MLKLKSKLESIDRGDFFPLHRAVSNVALVAPLEIGEVECQAKAAKVNAALMEISTK